jgi:hypothetical protein
MRGDDVIYYQFDADQHCIECTRELYGPSGNVEPAHGYGYVETLSDGSAIELDQNEVRLNSHDSRGNPVHPVFATDESEYPVTACGTCGFPMCLSCGTVNSGADFCWDCHTDFTYREEDDDA